jgi:hypothetical protein
MQLVLIIDVSETTDRPAIPIAHAMRMAAAKIEPLYPLVEGEILDAYGVKVCTWKLGEFSDWGPPPVEPPPEETETRRRRS